MSKNTNSKRQITIVHNGESYTFHTNAKGIYNPSLPNARNRAALNAMGEGGGNVNIESLRDRLKN